MGVPLPNVKAAVFMKRDCLASKNTGATCIWPFTTKRYQSKEHMWEARSARHQSPERSLVYDIKSTSAHSSFFLSAFLTLRISSPKRPTGQYHESTFSRDYRQMRHGWRASGYYKQLCLSIMGDSLQKQASGSYMCADSVPHSKCRRSRRMLELN